MRQFGFLLLALTSAWIGCAAPPSPALTLALPSRFTVERGQLRIHSDFPLPERHRLFDDLSTLQRDLAERLALEPSDEPIDVYLFENTDRFENFVRRHHPSLPDRRAFFLETDTRLVVYAQWGNRVSEDLRHEITHGVLHAVEPDIPLWLDEGLAEYFETPRAAHGLNVPHVERIASRLRAGGHPNNLPRLEQLKPDAEMTQDEYADAWAWVHFLLDDPAQNGVLIRAYLADLRRDGRATEISERLATAVPQPNEAMLAHLRTAARR